VDVCPCTYWHSFYILIFLLSLQSIDRRLHLYKDLILFYFHLNQTSAHSLVISLTYNSNITSSHNIIIPTIQDQFNTENNDSGSYSDEQDRTRSNANPETTSTNNNSQYQIRQRAAKLTHYVTPDAVEFNGRRLPAEIAEYAMAGDLTMEQLDDYEQRLLREEEKEEVKFNFLRDDFSTKAGGCRGSKRRDVADQQDGISVPSGKKILILPPRESRLRFFGFQQGKVNVGNNTRNNTYATTQSTPNSQETFRQMWEKSKSKVFSTMNISE